MKLLFGGWYLLIFIGLADILRLLVHNLLPFPKSLRLLRRARSCFGWKYSATDLLIRVLTLRETLLKRITRQNP